MKMSTIYDCSIEQFLQKTEEERQNFYDQICLASHRKERQNTRFKTAIRTIKPKRALEFMQHQEKGRLSFICELRRRDKEDKNYYVLALCDCGNWNISQWGGFANETTLSCGCYMKEKVAENGRANAISSIPIEETNDLIVVKSTDMRDHEEVIWECKCKKCGKINYRKRSDLITYIKPYCEFCGEKPMSLGAERICQLLEENNIEYTTEKTFDTCVFKDSGRKAKFDFFVKNRYIIEYDGPQHTKSCTIGGISQDLANENFIKTQQRDQYKNKWCKDNNIPLIRIPYIRNLNTLKIEDLLLETTTYLL